MSTQCAQFVRKVMDSFMSASGLEARLLNNLALESAKPGHLLLTLPVEQMHTNRLGILHGGAIASLVDISGSLVVASHGLWHTGVSTDLNTTFVSSGGKPGDVIRAEVACDKLGRTMAYTSVRFLNARDQVFARGSHTKYIANAWGDERNIAKDISNILR